MLVCPKCGSERIKPDPIMLIYFCPKCGYNGTLVIETKEDTTK